MRVANERGHRRIRIRHRPKQRFELAGGAIQEKIAMKCVSHGVSANE
jgi:hypothetical protein